MSEQFDVYSDEFQINMNPWGSVLNFGVSNPQPLAPGQMPNPTRLGTVRMSTEHLKCLVFLCWRQIKQVERSTGLEYPLPLEVLNSLQISLEDWQSFWKN